MVVGRDKGESGGVDDTQSVSSRMENVVFHYLILKINIIRKRGSERDKTMEILVNLQIFNGWIFSVISEGTDLYFFQP